jgi:hypothetical protein
MAGPTPFKAELLRIARAEAQSLLTFCRGDRELEERIKCYGREVGIFDLSSYEEHYSAVFISWCMRKAGASPKEFPEQISHAKYAAFALRNAEAERGLFRARRIEAYEPQPGDLIHMNRDGGQMNYDQVANNQYYPAESGVVAEIGRGEAHIVLGNQLPCGNVGMETVALTKSGLLVQRPRDQLICIIEVLK